MSSSSAAGEVCTSCGSRIVTTASGDLGCLSCLLRAGAEDEPDLTAATPQMPDSFGAYVIARHEEGSPHELGRGAMGITFLAEDVSLQRPVALKIIKADFGRGGSDARERFMREARAAAALRHPHVATVYQFGMDDETGQYFCAMELVEGETLEERVRRTGPLDSPTVVEIARQVTAALAAAEARGLVHRDLKPGNIMIASESEDGKIAVKVIDFGVAKALQDAPDARTLTHGGFVGTPAFASPEQLRGKSIDVRSDIYSLGATIWFLLTGTLPLGDGEPSENGNSSKPSSPRLAQLKAAHVPARLRSLLMTMLAAEPAARPGTRDLAERLERIQAQVSDSGKLLRRAAFAFVVAALLTGGIWIFHTLETRPARAPSNASPKSIAVLPFENLSDDKKNAYFTEGVQDQILTELARISDLKVISRTSVLQYKSGIARNLHEIGQELGVAHLLEGSVQRYGGKVRVNAQLIDARTDAHLWAHSYDRNLEDVLAIQTEIAKTIAGQLQAKLSPEEKAAIEKPATTDLAAYELYLRALALYADTTSSLSAMVKLPKAVRLLDEAVARDPHFLLGWCLLSKVQGEIYFFGHDHSPARLELAKAAVDGALRFHPDAGETHLALAYYYYHGFRDFSRARNELAMARRTLPNNAEVFEYASYAACREGRWGEATQSMERAVELDPRNSLYFQQLALTYQPQRRYAEAERAWDRALAIVPGDPFIRLSRSEIALDWRGDIKPYQTTMAAVIAEDPNAAPDLEDPFYTLCERSNAAAERLLQNYPRGGVFYGVNYPHAYWEGVVARWQDNPAKARAAFTAARDSVAKTVENQPDFAQALALLGLIDAGLGRKEEALREGRRACELIPISKDALSGSGLIANLAQICAWTGEKDLAIELLTTVESAPTDLTYGLLKFQPNWDPLRSDPRFASFLKRRGNPWCRNEVSLASSLRAVFGWTRWSSSLAL